MAPTNLEFDDFVVLLATEYKQIIFIQLKLLEKL